MCAVSLSVQEVEVVGELFGVVVHRPSEAEKKKTMAQVSIMITLTDTDARVHTRTHTHVQHTHTHTHTTHTHTHLTDAVSIHGTDSLYHLCCLQFYVSALATAFKTFPVSGVVCVTLLSSLLLLWPLWDVVQYTRLQWLVHTCLCMRTRMCVYVSVSKQHYSVTTIP